MALRPPTIYTDSTNTYADIGVVQQHDLMKGNYSSWKQSVTAATTTSTNLSGRQEIDGILVEQGQRVLVKNQIDPSENGIYITSSDNWTRAVDLPSEESADGAAVYVDLGNTNGGMFFYCSTTFTGFSKRISEPGGIQNSIQYSISNEFSGSSQFTSEKLQFNSITTVGSISTGKSISPYTQRFENESLRIETPVSALPFYYRADTISISTGDSDVDDYAVLGKDIRLKYNYEGPDYSPLVRVELTGGDPGSISFITGESHGLNDGIIFSGEPPPFFPTVTSVIVSNDGIFPIMFPNGESMALSFDEQTISAPGSVTLSANNTRLNIDMTIPAMSSIALNLVRPYPSMLIKTSYAYSGSGLLYLSTDSSVVTVHNLGPSDILELIIFVLLL